MRFNDQTILCSNLQCQQFRYISSPNGGNSSENQEIFNFGEEPEYLQKKIKIISHFSKSLLSRYHLNDTKIDLKEKLVHILSYKISNTFFNSIWYNFDSIKITHRKVCPLKSQ